MTVDTVTAKTTTRRLPGKIARTEKAINNAVRTGGALSYLNWTLPPRGDGKKVFRVAATDGSGVK